MDRKQRQQLVARLNRDAAHIARHFGLRFRVVEAERAGVKRRYGVCYDDGTIRIRLCHARTGAPLRYSSLADTLCHELAHLRYWNHDARFRAYHQRLLAFARRAGIYRPRPRQLPRPRRAAPPQAPRRAQPAPRQAPQMALPVSPGPAESRIPRGYSAPR